MNCISDPGFLIVYANFLSYIEKCCGEYLDTRIYSDVYLDMDNERIIIKLE